MGNKKAENNKIISSLKRKRVCGRISYMWELHLQNKLLRILDGHHTKTGEYLARAGWEECALKSIEVNLHYPILAVFNRNGLRRKIQKVMGSCIPPHDGFLSFDRTQRGKYYTTFVSYPKEELAITEDDGLHFIGFGGYEQRVYELYKGFWIAVICIITSSIVWEFGRRYVNFIIPIIKDLL